MTYTSPPLPPVFQESISISGFCLINIHDVIPDFLYTRQREVADQYATQLNDEGIVTRGCVDSRLPSCCVTGNLHEGQPQENIDNVIFFLQSLWIFWQLKT